MTQRRELIFAKELAREAGKIMLEHFGQTKDSTEWKGDNTPLTIADTTINDLVLRKITQEFPEHAIISEEGSSNKRSDFTWFCDPIDGTFPYSSGIPTSVFTLALTYKGESQLGVVLDPFTDRLYWAERGKGAFMNDVKLQIDDKFPETLMVALEIYPGKILGQDKPFSKALWEYEAPERISFKLGSICYASARVASGEYHAAVWSGTKLWDTAAISLIIEEAGGVVTDFNGQKLRYIDEIYGFIAASPKVYKKILGMIQRTKQSEVRA